MWKDLIADLDQSLQAALETGGKYCCSKMRSLLEKVVMIKGLNFFQLDYSKYFLRAPSPY